MSFSGPTLPAARTTLVLALLLPATATADEHPYRDKALAEMYHYDVAPSPAEPTAEKPGSEPARKPRKRVADPAQRIPATNPVATSAPVGSATLAPDGTLVLPKMSVPGVRGKLPAPLPQIHLKSPVRNVGKGDAFETPDGRRISLETPAGRQIRLLNKYYTPAEQKIAKLLFNSLGGSAEAAEAAEQLNHLAYLIDLAAAAGLETPEDQQDLRAAYYELLGPKP